MAVLTSARFYLSVILSMALLLRVGLLIAQPRSETSNQKSIDRLPDQREYLSLAENLLHHRELSFFDPRFGQTVYAYRLPGYPVFLAAFGCSIGLIRLAQCLIDSSTVLAVFLIARQVTASNLASLIASIWVACNPIYIYFSSLLLSETLFTSLLAWAICLLLHRSPRNIVLGAMLLIAAAYIRTTGLLMAPAVVFAVATHNGRATAYARSKKIRVWHWAYCVSITVFFITLMLVCFYPWARRNHNILRSSVWNTTNDGITLFDGFNDNATGASDQRFAVQMPALMSMNEWQRSDYLARAAREWAMSNWTKIPSLTARKILRGWSPVPLSSDFGKMTYRVVSVGYFVPFDLLCLVGVCSPRLAWRSRLLLAMPALVVTLGQALTVGSIRYSMPAQAYLAVLATVGLIDVLAAAKIKMPKFE